MMSFFNKSYGIPLTSTLLKLWKRDGYHYYFIAENPGESDDLSLLRASSKMLIEGNIIDNYDWREIERITEKALTCPHSLIEFCPHFIDRFIERLGSEKMNFLKNTFETDIIGIVFYGFFLSQSAVKRLTAGQLLEEFLKCNLEDKELSKQTKNFNKYFEKEEFIYRKRNSTIVRFYDGAAILNWDNSGVVFTTFVDEDSLKESQNEYINVSLEFSNSLLRAFAEKI
jgi:hypothetical protein